MGSASLKSSQRIAPGSAVGEGSAIKSLTYRVRDSGAAPYQAKLIDEMNIKLRSGPDGAVGIRVGHAPFLHAAAKLGAIAVGSLIRRLQPTCQPA